MDTSTNRREGEPRPVSVPLEVPERFITRRPPHWVVTWGLEVMERPKEVTVNVGKGLRGRDGCLGPVGRVPLRIGRWISSSFDMFRCNHHVLHEPFFQTWDTKTPVLRILLISMDRGVVETPRRDRESGSGVDTLFVPGPDSLSRRPVPRYGPVSDPTTPPLTSPLLDRGVQRSMRSCRGTLPPPRKGFPFINYVKL